MRLGGRHVNTTSYCNFFCVISHILCMIVYFCNPRSCTPAFQDLSLCHVDYEDQARVLKLFGFNAELT